MVCEVQYWESIGKRVEQVFKTPCSAWNKSFIQIKILPSIRERILAYCEKDFEKATLCNLINKHKYPYQTWDGPSYDTFRRIFLEKRVKKRSFGDIYTKNMHDCKHPLFF